MVAKFADSKWHYKAHNAPEKHVSEWRAERTASMRALNMLNECIWCRVAMCACVRASLSCRDKSSLSANILIGSLQEMVIRDFKLTKNR